MNIILSYIPKSWASRSKALLKRRKKAIKSRPISQKKLKQQAKLFNYAKQYKALQIQKQLDRRTYPSQHINELMDEIFYPDVALAKEEATKIHLSISTLREYQFDQKEQMSKVCKQIKEKILATELIEIYHQHKDKIQVNDCITLFNRLQRYFKRYNRIKDEVKMKWERMNKNIKKKDKNYQQRKCPYIFIDKDDIFNFQPFNSMIDHFTQKMERKLSEQSTIIWNTLGMAQMIEDMYKGTGYNPFRLYEVFQTYLSKVTEQQLGKLQLGELDQILKSANLQSFIRYPMKNIIPTEQQRQKNNNKMITISKVKQTVILTMLSDPKIDSYQISTVLKSLKFGIVILTQQIQQKLRTAVLGNISSIPFQKVVDLFHLYLNNESLTDEETIISLKFDIFRKCPNAVSKAHLFQCLQFVDKRYFIFSQPNDKKVEQHANKLHLYGFDLFTQITNIILYKYCGKNELKYNEIDRLVKKCYTNNYTDINILQLICSQIVKLKKEYKLNQLTELVFKIYLLGYRSNIIIQILYEEQKKRYHETKIKIKENQILMIQGNKEEKSVDEHVDQSKMLSQQLMLQQDLIISLWLLLLTHSNKEGSKKLPLLIDELIKVYPLTTSSRHPLIYEFVLNLNQFTQSNKILWIIKCIRPTKQNEKQIVNNRLNQFYKEEENNIYLQSMKIQAKESSKFLMSYHVQDKKFIPSPWSKTKMYNVQAYTQWVIENPNNNTNYFNSESVISEKIKESRNAVRRSQIIQNKKEQDKERSTSQVVESNVKFYQID